MRRAVAAVLISMLLAGGAHAQVSVDAGPSPDWTHVTRLPEGTRVVVVDDRGHRHVGIVEEADDQAIRIRQRWTTATLVREQVVSVSVRELTGTSKRPEIVCGAILGALNGLAGTIPIALVSQPGAARVVEVLGGVFGAAAGAADAARKDGHARYSLRVIYVRQ